MARVDRDGANAGCLSANDRDGVLCGSSWRGRRCSRRRQRAEVDDERVPGRIVGRARNPGGRAEIDHERRAFSMDVRRKIGWEAGHGREVEVIGGESRGQPIAVARDREVCRGLAMSMMSRANGPCRSARTLI